MLLEDLVLPYSTDTQFLNVTLVRLYIVSCKKAHLNLPQTTSGLHYFRAGFHYAETIQER